MCCATSRSTRSMNSVRCRRGRVVVSILGRVDLRIGHRPDHVRERRGQRPERRDGPLAGLGVARVHDHPQVTTSSPVSSSGRNGIGGAGMTLAIVVSSSGAASAAAMNPATDVRRGRQDQHPAHDPVELVQPVLEPGRDAEVAAAATDRPEQVGVGRRRRRA